MFPRFVLAVLPVPRRSLLPAQRLPHDGAPTARTARRYPYFVQQYARRMNRRILSIPTESMNALARYHWPGNIRELQNFIERAVILTTGSTLHVPVRELKSGPVGASVVTLEAAEREAIQRALHDAGGKVGGDSGAAAKLGMKRTTLQAKMRKLGIETKPAG